MNFEKLTRILESILFASGNPVSISQISQSLKEPPDVIYNALEQLRNEYELGHRGIRLLQLEDSWQMVTASEYAGDIRCTLELRKPPPLSKASLEILSIIAYYQPVTKAYIEQIRGVDSSGTVNMLSDKGLIEDCGCLDVPGKPRLFRTTDAFLRTFGISSLSELPKLFSQNESVNADTLSERSDTDWHS